MILIKLKKIKKDNYLIYQIIHMKLKKKKIINVVIDLKESYEIKEKSKDYLSLSKILQI